MVVFSEKNQISVVFSKKRVNFEHFINGRWTYYKNLINDLRFNDNELFINDAWFFGFFILNVGKEPFLFNKKTDARGGGRLVSEARLDPWGHGVEVALYEPHTKCLIQIQCYPKKFCGSATQIGKPNFTCKSLLFMGHDLWSIP